MMLSTHAVGGPKAVRSLVIASAVLLPAACIHGAIALGDAQVGGFFSQGYLTTSDDVNFPAGTDGGTADFRESALNFTMPLGAKLRVGAQVFEYRLGDYGDDRVVLDWASLDYNVAPQFGVRVGRVKRPFALYNEALDLDLVRPFVFLPAGIYDPRLRDFNASVDGAMIYGSLEAGAAGSIDYKAYYGDASISTRDGSGVADYLRNSQIMEPTAAGIESTYGGTLFWNTPVAGLRAGLSYAVMDTMRSRGVFVPFPVTEVTLDIDAYKRLGLSTEYLAGNWTFAAEITQDSGHVTIANPAVGLNNPSRTETINWYVSAARRLNERLELGAYHSRSQSRSLEDDPSQADTALSVRVDVNEHVLVKLEGHYIDGTSQVFNTPSAPNPGLAGGQAFTLFAAKLTLSF